MQIRSKCTIGASNSAVCSHQKLLGLRLSAAQTSLCMVTILWLLKLAAISKRFLRFSSSWRLRRKIRERQFTFKINWLHLLFPYKVPKSIGIASKRLRNSNDSLAMKSLQSRTSVNWLSSNTSLFKIFGSLSSLCRITFKRELLDGNAQADNCQTKSDDANLPNKHQFNWSTNWIPVLIENRTQPLAVLVIYVLVIYGSKLI